MDPLISCEIPVKNKPKSKRKSKEIIAFVRNDKKTFTTHFITPFCHRHFSCYRLLEKDERMGLAV